MWQSFKRTKFKFKCLPVSLKHDVKYHSGQSCWTISNQVQLHFLQERPFYWLFPPQLTEPSPCVKSSAAASLRLQGRELSLAKLDQESWSLAPIILMNTGSHRHSGQQKKPCVPFVLVKLKGRAQWTSGVPRNVSPGWSDGANENLTSHTSHGGACSSTISSFLLITLCSQTLP